MTISFDPNSPSSYVARSVTFTPVGSDLALEAVIVEHDPSRDGIRHLFKIHVLDAQRGRYPVRTVATAEELTDRPGT